MNRTSKSVFKAVRLSPSEAQTLTALAEERRSSESSVLRWALAIAQKLREKESGAEVSQAAGTAF